MGIASNLSRLVRQPAMIGEYGQWLLSSATSGGKPYRKLLGGIEVGSFTNFSEFHSVTRFIDEDERAFFETATFGEGAIIDIGANVGLVSLLLARRFTQTPIFAFEPNPSTYDALRDNLARNHAGHVSAHRLAVSDADGTVLFHNDPVKRGTASISVGSGDYSTEVQATTLDSFVLENAIDKIGLMKVDVEGFETMVFRGATKVLSEIRPASIYFEICPILSERAGFAATEPARILQDAGYDLFRLGDGGTLRPAKLEEIAGINLDNWLARPR